MKIITNLLLILFLTLPITSCKKDKVKTETKTLKMAIGYIPHVQFSPLYVGIEKGIFEKHGIDLEIQYGFGLDIFSLLLSNKIDCALSDSDQLIISGDKNLNNVSFFQYYQKYPVSIVSKSSIITKPEDLIGKKIGLPDFFGTSYIGTLIFLENYGLQDKVELIKIGYTQIPSLIADQVDAAICFFNNEPIQLKKKGVKINEWEVKDFSDIVGASFITTETKFNNNSDTFNSFKLALKEAIEYTVNNKKESLDISYKFIVNLNQKDKDYWYEVLEKTCELFYTESEYGTINKNAYNHTIEKLNKLKLIKTKYDASKIIR